MLFVPTSVSIDHWYTFYRWYKTENWAALGSVVSGVAALISSVSVFLIWKQNRFAYIQADAAKQTLQTLMDDRIARKNLDFPRALESLNAVGNTILNVFTGIENKTLQTFPTAPIYPQNWPQSVLTMVKRSSPAKQDEWSIAVKFGIQLSELDRLVQHYRSQSDGSTKSNLESTIYELASKLSEDLKAVSKLFVS